MPGRPSSASHDRCLPWEQRPLLKNMTSEVVLLRGYIKRPQRSFFGPYFGRLSSTTSNAAATKAAPLLNGNDGATWSNPKPAQRGPTICASEAAACAAHSMTPCPTAPERCEMSAAIVGVPRPTPTAVTATITYNING